MELFELIRNIFKAFYLSEFNNINAHLAYTISVVQCWPQCDLLEIHKTQIHNRKCPGTDKRNNKGTFFIAERLSASKRISHLK